MIITKDCHIPLVPTETSNVRNDTSILYISGSLGAATIKLFYFDDFNQRIYLNNGTGFAVDTQNTVLHGKAMNLYLEVSDADAATNLSIKISGVG